MTVGSKAKIENHSQLKDEFDREKILWNVAKYLILKNCNKDHDVIPANAGIQSLNVTPGFASSSSGFPRSRE